MRNLVLVLGAGCASGSATVSEEFEVTVGLSLPDGAVLDPKLGGSLAVAVSVEADDACETTLTATHPDGSAVEIALDESLAGVWDGLAGDGLPFEPGPVHLGVVATCESGAVGSAEEMLFVVRLGVVAVNLTDHPADQGNVELAYHKTNLWDVAVTAVDTNTPEYWAGVVGGTADLDDESGQPAAAPKPWDNPDFPPWGTGSPGGEWYSIPAAYVAGSRYRVWATLGERAVSSRTGEWVGALGAETYADLRPSVRMVPDGLDAISSSQTAEPGEVSAFDGDALSTMLGKTELQITWRFEASMGEGEWFGVPGEQPTTHPIYLLAGHPALLDGTAVGAAPDIPWVGVIDDLAPALQGIELDADSDAAVLDAVRTWLYDNAWLVYDPSDDAYTEYSGQYIYWESIEADLSGWLDRDDGVNLYCHSMSCLLSTLVGNVGVDAPQLVLGVGFETNYARAAGTEDWGTWTFNSHSVVSPDGGTTIWDASIDLDGDDDPSSVPIDAVSPMGMDGDEYFWRLTFDDIDIVNTGSCYIR